MLCLSGFELYSRWVPLTCIVTKAHVPAETYHQPLKLEPYLEPVCLQNARERIGYVNFRAEVNLLSAD